MFPLLHWYNWIGAFPSAHVSYSKFHWLLSKDWSWDPTWQITAPAYIVQLRVSAPASSIRLAIICTLNSLYTSKSRVTLWRSCLPMDSQIENFGKLGKIGEDREHIGLFVCPSLRSLHTVPKLIPDRSTNMYLRQLLREFFGMPKISWRGCQRYIFVCLSGINLGTVWDLH